MNFIDTLPNRIRPTFPDMRARDPWLDDTADGICRRYLQEVRAEVQSAEFDDRFARATMFLLPYLSRVFKGRNLRALEVGCGEGAKAIALANVFGEYVGLDIVPRVIKTAQNVSRKYGLKNTHFEVVEAANLGKFLEVQERRFDIILLYAVLEHLTVEEKLDLLRLCWNYLSDDGHLFVGEAPNRMVPTDFHSSKLLYFQCMPLDLWRRYYERSPHESWRRALDGAVGKEQFEHVAFRRGLHIGHQEFELGLPSVARLSDHMVADNFAVEMLNLYPYTPVEFLKLCEFDQLTSFSPGVRLVPIEFPRVFSRYYVEMLLQKGRAPVAADRGFRALVPGESGMLSNHRLSEGLLLAKGATYAVPATALPEGNSELADVTLVFHRPAECGVLEVMTADGSAVAEIDVAGAMKEISKWRANLAVRLPAVEVRQLPLTLRVSSDTPVTLKFILLER